MADAAEFVIRLQQQVSGPAGVAQRALSQLEAQIQREQAAIGQLGVSMKGGAFRDAKGRFVSQDDVAKVNAMHESLGTLNGALGGFKAAAAAEAAEQARKPMVEFGQSMLDSAQSATRVPGPIGAVQDALTKLGPEGAAAAVAIGLVTAAITALVVVMAGGMAAAIHINEQLEQMRVRFEALAGGAKAGGQVFDMVQKLGQSLPFATAQIGSWAQSLLAAGVPADKLQGKIKAIAAAEALIGGGAAAEELFKKLGSGGAEAEAFLKKISKGGKQADAELKRMGLTLQELGGAEKVAKMKASELSDAIAKALQKKGAGPLQELGATFPVMLQKIKEGFFGLFDGLGPAVKPFMAQVQALASEFYRGGAAAKVLKPIITTVFSTLFSWGTRALTAIHAGLLQLIIWALKAYIALHPLLAKIKEFATSENTIRGLKVAFVLLAVAVALAALPFIVLGVAVAIFIAAIVAIGAATVSAAGAIAGFVGDAAAALSEWISTGASAAGDFITALVNGIGAGAGAVAQAVRSMASGAVQALRDTLGWHSPPRIAVDAASAVTGTFADTIDAGAPDVARSMGAMVDPKALDVKRRGGRGEGAGGRGRNINFNNCTFGDVSEGTIRQMILAMLEGESGGGPEPEAA